MKQKWDMSEDGRIWAYGFHSHVDDMVSGFNPDKYVELEGERAIYRVPKRLIDEKHRPAYKNAIKTLLKAGCKI